MTGSDGYDELNGITDAAGLGVFLRKLRGDKTQGTIARRATAANFYLHRPDLSTIENGRRLPSKNELRGILHTCDRLDLADRLEEIRQQLLNRGIKAAESQSREYPAAPQTPRWSRLQIGLIVFLASVIVLAASFYAVGMLRWRWPDDNTPELRLQVPRPVPGDQPCSERKQVIDTPVDGEASGSIKLRECPDTLEIWIADLDRDSRCIYAEIRWSPEQIHRTKRACPVGSINVEQIPRIKPDYTVELVSIYRP
ncbi:MAG: hypothetical protein ACT4NY_24015 [Pseudonocardiales bacterium]